MKDQHEKIKGYRDLTQEEIDLMNECKELGASCFALIEKLSHTSNIDARWLSIGTTDMQKGMMALVRSIARPKGF